MDNKVTYSGSQSKGEPKELSRSFTRFAAKALLALIIVGLFSGCGANKSVLRSLEREHLNLKARAQEQAPIRYSDPKRDEKHDRRKRVHLRREKKRLKELERQMELAAELAAEQWWIEKELAALQDADEQRARDDEEVKRWREKEEQSKKELELISMKDLKANEDIKVKEAPKSFEQRVLDSLGMVYIKGGCFEVDKRTGASDAEKKADSEQCVDDFYVGRHEITIGEFMEFVDETGYLTDAERDGGCYLYTGNTWYKTSEWKKKNVYHWRNISFEQNQDHPVACVSWDDANEFVEWKSRKHGIKYRLPTEAEWEFAASDGDYREKWSGTNEEGDVGIYAWNFNNSNNRTHPVGQKKPNKFGLFDMSGNVWEWVQDNYDHSDSSEDNSDKSLRVIRGGSWYSIYTNLSTDRRFKHLEPNYRDFASGFRLGMDGRIKLNKVSSIK